MGMTVMYFFILGKEEGSFDPVKKSKNLNHIGKKYMDFQFRMCFFPARMAHLILDCSKYFFKAKFSLSPSGFVPLSNSDSM